MRIFFLKNDDYIKSWISTNTYFAMHCKQKFLDYCFSGFAVDIEDKNNTYNTIYQNQ